MFSKIFVGIFFFMWVRWTLPRFRYDQLMRLGWTILIPLAIFNIVLTGGLIFTGVIPEVKQWWLTSGLAVR
jgi:NADH-quinone oxidoreductase subunit H